MTHTQRLINTLSFLLLLFIPTMIWGQYIDPKYDKDDPKQEQVITMKNGDVMVGKIKHIDYEKVYFIFHNNEIEITRKDIQTIQIKGAQKSKTEKLSSFRNGSENLLYSPTAFSLKKNDAEYRSYYILGHTLDYGISDHVTIGGGLVIPYIMMGKIKWGTNSENTFNFAAGSNLYFPIVGNSSGFVMNPYASISLGTPKSFFNIHIGSFALINGAGENASYMTLGGKFNLSSQWNFTTDNFIFFVDGLDETYFLPTFGFNWFKNGNRIDFGLTVFRFFIGEEQLTTFPYITYARRF